MVVFEPGGAAALRLSGYGHNSPAVGQGQRISQQQADAWLLQDVAQAAAAVDQLLAGVALSPQQRDALISFCFNVGAGALVPWAPWALGWPAVAAELLHAQGGS